GRLGNTRAVCRSYYIYPPLLEAYRKKELGPVLEALQEELLREEGGRTAALKNAPRTNVSRINPDQGKGVKSQKEKNSWNGKSSHCWDSCWVASIRLSVNPARGMVCEPSLQTSSKQKTQK